MVVLRGTVENMTRYTSRNLCIPVGVFGPDCCMLLRIADAVVKSSLLSVPGFPPALWLRGVYGGDVSIKCAQPSAVGQCVCFSSRLPSFFFLPSGKVWVIKNVEDRAARCRMAREITIMLTGHCRMARELRIIIILRTSMALICPVHE